MLTYLIVWHFSGGTDFVQEVGGSNRCGRSLRISAMVSKSRLRCTSNASCSNAGCAINQSRSAAWLRIRDGHVKEFDCYKLSGTTGGTVWA